MGNRGGRLHRPDRMLGPRRWASQQWICCRLQFNHRQRQVWGDSYSELFFLDEPTALAAGHRPCFECRRQDAEAFAGCFATSGKVRAADMDNILHAERLDGKTKRRHRLNSDALPDGAFIVVDDDALAVRGNRLLPWTPSGYTTFRARPRAVMVDVLTPPSMVAALSGGYRPLWHSSAG